MTPEKRNGSRKGMQHLARLFSMDKYGVDINPKFARDLAFENLLTSQFIIEQDNLLLLAAMDDTKRHNLIFVLFYNEDFTKYRGAQVNYCKKTMRFDFIQ